MTTTSDVDAAVARLIELMHETAGRELAERQLRLDGAVELKDVPVNSRTMRSFLVAVEDAFDHVWEIDTPDDVFRSLTTLAEYLVDRRDRGTR